MASTALPHRCYSVPAFGRVIRGLPGDLDEVSGGRGPVPIPMPYQADAPAGDLSGEVEGHCVPPRVVDGQQWHDGRPHPLGGQALEEGVVLGPEHRTRLDPPGAQEPLHLGVCPADPVSDQIDLAKGPEPG
jgi:hypothetical protein